MKSTTKKYSYILLKLVYFATNQIAWLSSPFEKHFICHTSCHKPFLQASSGAIQTSMPTKNHLSHLTWFALLWDKKQAGLQKTTPFQGFSLSPWQATLWLYLEWMAEIRSEGLLAAKQAT